jgi:hypothetical protein
MEDLMRRILVVMFAVGIAVLGSAAGFNASNAPTMLIKVDFSFYAADEQIPAGEYLVELRDLGYGSATGSMVVIRNRDGSVFHYLPARAQSNYRFDPNLYVAFTKIGDSYFMSKVHHSEFQANLSKSRIEKEVTLAYSKKLQPAPAVGIKVAATK